MKLADLIIQLTAIHEEHGNLTVYTNDWFNSHAKNITRIQTQHTIQIHTYTYDNTITDTETIPLQDKDYPQAQEDLKNEKIIGTLGEGVIIY